MTYGFDLILVKDHIMAEETTQDLKQAIEFISSLISISHSSKVFGAKWQLIRNKLEELNAGLLAAENCHSDESQALSGIVPAILGTVKEGCDLARRCVDLSYSGKLLMQSDLDVILSKFDCHVKNLSGVYTAGMLTHRYALVVSRPSLGACKDDMRFYVSDLLTRMKVGDFDMKRQALVNLHEIVMDEDKYVRIIVEDDDVISLLINFLDSTETELQEQSAMVISAIAGLDSYKGVLIGAGIVAPLVRALEAGSERGKETSAYCLQKLTENADNAWCLSAHGGVTTLLKICSADDSKGELTGPACGVLRNLVGVEEIRRYMIEEGAVSIGIKLARSTDESVQISSIDLLQALVNEDESVRQMVTKEDGTCVLVHLLDPNSSFSSKTRETAFRAIEKIYFSSVCSVNILLNHGFMDHILYFLRHGLSVQELALKAVHRLCGTSEEIKKSMGDAGFMPELVKMLDVKSMEAREMAAEALSSMVVVPKNRKKFLQDDRNISTILQLLDPAQGLTNSRKFLLSILMSLTSCNSGRRKIANSEYLKNVEKLAEAEGSDAKRLVRKLSANRFLSMLSGIWHS